MEIRRRIIVFEIDIYCLVRWISLSNYFVIFLFTVLLQEIGVCHPLKIFFKTRKKFTYFDEMHRFSTMFTLQNSAF